MTLDVSEFPRVMTVDWCKQHGYVRIFDAVGNEIQKVIQADRWTGEVEQYVLDEQDRLVVEGNEIRRQRVTYPAPLRAEWLVKQASIVEPS